MVIPEEVYQKGAELHREFVVCRFFGRVPAYTLIQNVLNYMWGKGKHLEIHMSPTTNSVLVRLPNDFVREKVTQKGFWYVDTTMFHASQWAAHADDYSPSLQRVQLWAHLVGVPFDLIHKQGLSHIAGQIGEPKETDDWTLNLTSISVAHVKVEIDTTLPLPSIIEVGRQNGTFVNVAVEYPWVPPICAHCKDVGHISRNCPLIPLPPKATPSHTAPEKPSHKKNSNHTCYSCKQSGHLMRNCPKGPQEWTQVRPKGHSNLKKSHQEKIVDPVVVTESPVETTVSGSSPADGLLVAVDSTLQDAPTPASDMAVDNCLTPTKTSVPSVVLEHAVDCEMNDVSPPVLQNVVVALSAPFVNRPVIPLPPPLSLDIPSPKPLATAINPFTLPPPSPDNTPLPSTPSLSPPPLSKPSLLSQTQTLLLPSSLTLNLPFLHPLP